MVTRVGCNQRYKETLENYMEDKSNFKKRLESDEVGAEVLGPASSQWRLILGEMRFTMEEGRL